LACKVEKVLEQRVHRVGQGTRTEYLARWAGCGPAEDLYEPLKNLNNSPEALRDFGEFLAGEE